MNKSATTKINSPTRNHSGHPGPDRAMLYSTIIATGFRMSEAFSLTPESFNLDHADGPSVVVTAGYTKDRL